MPVGVLIWMRLSIIGWAWLSLIPSEFVIDSIESELERRGIDTGAM